MAAWNRGHVMSFCKSHLKGWNSNFFDLSHFCLQVKCNFVIFQNVRDNNVDMYWCHGGWCQNYLSICSCCLHQTLMSLLPSTHIKSTQSFRSWKRDMWKRGELRRVTSHCWAPNTNKEMKRINHFSFFSTLKSCHCCYVRQSATRNMRRENTYTL